MLEHRHLPDADRLSVLAAAILLAYALARFVDIPVRELSMQLPGVYIVQIDIRTAIALLVAGLTATGADWLLRQHPALHAHSNLEHWMLPADRLGYRVATFSVAPRTSMVGQLWPGCAYLCWYWSPNTSPSTRKMFANRSRRLVPPHSLLPCSSP